MRGDMVAKDHCKVCDRNTNNAFICRRCAGELHDLLVGARETEGTQPGIVWYAKRLRESALRQTRLGRSASVRGTSTGYDLLGDHRAADLLKRINATLAVWEAHCDRLAATHRPKHSIEHSGSPTRDFERLEARRARFIAAHVTLIRHYRPDADRLHKELLEYATTAWRIINRPNDICCGPCPTVTVERSICDLSDPGIEKVCATMLYAEEGASTVQCSRCRTVHDVESLRASLRTSVKDMLFTRAELINLMATRLNDRIPQPTFSKLLRDGRLRPRKYEDDVAMYTYDDVCEARRKPVPNNKIRSA